MTIDTPTGTVTFEPCKECDQKDGEIAWLTTALDESFSREATFRWTLMSIRHDLESGNRIDLMIDCIHDALANPNPSAKSLLQDAQAARTMFDNENPDAVNTLLANILRGLSREKYRSLAVSLIGDEWYEFLRDRNRLALFMNGEIYLHKDTENAFRLFRRFPEGLDVALTDCKKTKVETIDAAIAAEEEPSQPDPNEVATPDVVADLQSGRW